MTQINATILSKEDFDKKKEQMDALLVSIDLYSSVEQTKETQVTAQDLLDDLAKNLYALDCAYLDAKVQTYTELVELLKSKE